MTASWGAPHITYVERVDLTELEGLRAAINHDLGPDERRVTVLPFIARSVLQACADHPKLNATYDPQSGTLHIHGAVHLGIATQTDRGLVVPVVRDADRLSLLALTREIHALADAARNGSADREQLVGSTITITSLGPLGGIMNTPILNTPEVAIVGVNKIEVRPMWDGSSFVPRSVMNVSASFDHRVIDGWDAAVFVQRIKRLLETPALLTLGWMR
jgi:2-oxoisovalerate dehydrogenase E2 component (dihydrolipoyl transacylase)